MDKIKLKPFIKKMKKEHAQVKKKLNIDMSDLFSSDVIFKSVCVVLLSGTRLIAGATPLGFSLAVSLFSGTVGYFYMALSILSLLFHGSSLYVGAKYIVASVLFSLIYERFVPEKSKEKLKYTIGALSLLLSGSLILFLTKSVGGFPLIYDSVVLICESATIYVASIAFNIAINTVFSLNLRRSLTAEQTVSLAFFAGGVISGLGKIGISNVFSLSGVLCVFCVLCFATRFGSLHGCSAGIIMGLTSCLSRGRIDACASSFALSGLCAGYFSKYGKWASCISFIMANAVITVLSNGSTEVLINISDTFIASLLLYVLPNKVFDAIQGIGIQAENSATLCASKLKYTSDTIKKCEKDFREISSVRSTDTNKILLYKRTAHRVCRICGLKKYCWGRDRSQTLSTLDKLSEKMKGNEPLNPEDSPQHCMRKDQFTEEFYKMYDLYKNDCIWSSRISEFQDCVYMSFEGIASLIDKSCEKLREYDECDSIASDNVKCRLRKEGIGATEVIVSGHGDNTRVRIKLESCGGFGRCETAVQQILDESLGMNFIKTGIRCCGNCNCTYVVKPDFSVSTAVRGAVKANKKVSGDYALYALIDRNTYGIVLCDGMGSGEIAKEESRRCASLLMELLESGLDGQSAINIVNSMLLFSSAGSLAAIDLCLINLTDGSSVIYKCGSAETFARIKKETTHIDSSSLPAGADSKGDTDFFTIPSEKGSIIVLVSDGVTELQEKSNPWIKNLINEFDGTEPDKLASLILEHAKKSSKSLKDDITVVASFIG